MRRPPLIVVAALAAAALAAGAALTQAATGSITTAAVPGGTATRLQVPAAATQPSDVNERLARLLTEQVNAERLARGLAPYEFDTAAAAAAAEHSADQAAHGRMSHTGSDGSDAGERLARHGVSWSTWGETLAAGFTDPAAVLQAWLASASHRPIVLSSTFTRVGTGVAAAPDGVLYWTMDAIG